MSGEPTPQPESSPQPPAEAPKSEKKPRSPVERVVVWGGIIVLLALVAVQAHARFGYQTTLNRLTPLIPDDYEGGEPLRLEDVDRYVLGFPLLSSSEDNATSEDRGERVYRWYGLGRPYGMTLSWSRRQGLPLDDTGAQPEFVVTALVTEGAPPPPEPTFDESIDEAPGGPEFAGDAGPSGPPMHDPDYQLGDAPGEGGADRPRRPERPGDDEPAPTDPQPAESGDEPQTSEEPAADGSEDGEDDSH